MSPRVETKLSTSKLSWLLVIVVLVAFFPNFIFYGKGWWQPFTSVLQSVAVLTTLLFVIRYTDATGAMARATVLMAMTEQEVYGLRMQPVVSVSGQAYETDGKLEFATKIENHSDVHAKLRVVFSIEVGGQWIPLPADQYYGGVVWALQARTPFPGALGLPQAFHRMGLKSPILATQTTRVKAEVWVTNYFASVEKLAAPESKNPTVFWSWDGKRCLMQPVMDESDLPRITT
jgi:hypothetical protein